MTNLIENFLYKLDNTFADKDEKEVYMIYAMIFAGLFALSYFLFWDSAEKDFNMAHNKVTKMQTNITTDNSYLSANPESKIAAIENQTENTKLQFADTQENNEYIKFSIEKISELYYDAQTWGKYINSISRHAKAENIHLVELSNSFADQKEAFGHVLDISIKANGQYKNLLKFVNRLEESFLVVDLHDFAFTTKEKLAVDLNISVWGIKY